MLSSISKKEYLRAEFGLFQIVESMLQQRKSNWIFNLPCTRHSSRTASKPAPQQRMSDLHTHL